MRNMFVAALLLLALTACEDKKSQRLDPNAKVYINAAPGVKSASNPQHLTPLEIVQQANYLSAPKFAIGIGDSDRDIPNLRFKIWSTYVINDRGELELEFITARDFVFAIMTPSTIDTIAYIPNSAMEHVDKYARIAFEAGDYTECYRLLEEAYTFVPITGKEWRELKAQGKN